MSQELFYTSAPKGLRPGSRGFCTVAATHGLSAALMEKLESLSGYRPLFPPHDARAGLNPVAFAHIRISAGGRMCTVVSRIGPAGLDYTERPNKFAHHVVLDAAELPVGGPAWLLRQPGFLESRWDGEVQVLPAGRLPPHGDVAPDVCRNWQTLTGDAGWAGVLAEAFQADPARLVYLIFEPGMDVLPLLAESLALLPPEQRWEVTFSTYFTGLPQGVQCSWRCVPRGSPEAKGARQFPNALILDVGDELGAARGGALVARARGQAAGKSLEGNGDADLYTPRKAAEYVHTPPPSFGREIQDSRSSHSAAASSLQPFGEATPLTAPPPPLPPAPPPKAGRNWGWFAGGLVGLSVGLAAGVFVTLGLNNFRSPPGEIAKEDPKTKVKNVKAVVPAKVEPAIGDAQGKRLKEATRLLVEESVRDISGCVSGLIASGNEIAGGLRQWVSKLPVKTEQPQRIKESSTSPENAIRELVKQTKKQKGSAKLPDTIREQWAKLDSKLYGWVNQFEAARAQFIPKTIRHYVRLRSALPGEDRIFLPEELKKLGKPDNWTLRLAGLNKDLGQKFNDQSLLIKKGNTRLAEFRLDGADLFFKWEDTGDKNADARGWVRNSVLQVKAGDVNFFFGLNRLETDPGIPHKFAMAQSIQQKLLLSRNKDDIPEREVYFDFAVCEMGGQIRVLQALPDENKLQWGSKVVLRLEKDDAKPPRFQIVAHWIGGDKDKTDLILHAFAAYTKVDGHRVEVWRVWGKSK